MKPIYLYIYGPFLCLGIFAPMQKYNAIHESYIYIWTFLCLGVFARMQTHKAMYET